VVAEFSFQLMAFHDLGLYWITGDHLFFVVNHVLVFAWNFTTGLFKAWTCGEYIFQVCSTVPRGQETF
jgi:hypothetical protein